jgi:glycosyltransferase involved in cell wall biosynthesis
MMNVGIVAEQLRQSVPGGIGTYAAGLLKGLVELGDGDLSVAALASRPNGDDQLGRLGVEVRSSRWSHRVQVALWDAGLSRPPSDLDVLHRTSLAGPSSRSGTPATVMVHDLGWRRNPELTTSRGRRWHEAALGRVLSSPAELIVPSVGIAEDLEEAGSSPDRIHVIAEGADHLPRPDLDAAERLLRRHGIEGEFILTVSTLEPRKNLQALVAAHDQAARCTEVPPLLIVGPSGWGDVEVAASDRVVLAGPADPGVLAALYATCTLFAYVPVHEGFGLPPLEAMAQGAPVLASTAVPSMEHAPVVASVAASSVDEIADGIVAALGDRAALLAAGSAGRSHAGRSRWVDVAAAHVALWRELS